MKKQNILAIYFCGNKTPEVFNVDNPVQAEGAARGREWRRVPHNPVGVELRTTVCCAPTEHRYSELHRHTPSYTTLARGYYLYASYGGRGYPTYPYTVALGSCLNSYALYGSELSLKISN